MQKKFYLAAVIVFVSVSIMNFLLHGIILSGLYSQSAFWRPKADMNKMMWIIYVSTFISSIAFTYIYYKGIANKSPYRGLWYGLSYGIAVGVGMGYSTYAMLPMPYGLAIGWFLGAIITYGIAGWIAGMIMKEK